MQQQLNPSALRQILITHFNAGELRDLCFDLNIDYEDLSGEGKADKARELVAYAQRRGRTADLVERCRQLRPHADWQAVGGSGGATPTTQPPATTRPQPTGDRVGGDRVGGDKIVIGSISGNSNVVIGHGGVAARGMPASGPPATSPQSKADQTASATGLPAIIDLAIVTALREELEPVLNLIGGEASWKRLTIGQYIYYFGQFPCGARPLHVVACALWQYGGTATAAQVTRLQQFKPRMIAMSGICAGWQEKGIQLGDVLVADRAFNMGQGKQTEAGFLPDTRTYQPPPWLLSWLKDFSFDRQWAAAITTPRPPSLRYQADWLLCQRAALGAAFPASREDWETLKANRIDYLRTQERLAEQKFIAAKGALTKKAQQRLDTLKAHNYGQLAPLPDPPQPAVHYKAFATSEAVVAVDDPFADLAKIMRSVGALEMEVASLFDAASQISVPAFAVKGVSDYATTEKDDAFHTYAAEAAARWLYAFVCRNADQLQQIRPAGE